MRSSGNVYCVLWRVVGFPLPSHKVEAATPTQQLIISLLFAAGGIVCIEGGVRTYYTYLETSSFDQTWAAYPVWLFGPADSMPELYDEKK
jgi:hypothetical protein